MWTTTGSWLWWKWLQFVRSHSELSILSLKLVIEGKLRGRWSCRTRKQFDQWWKRRRDKILAGWGRARGYSEGSRRRRGIEDQEGDEKGDSLMFYWSYYIYQINLSNNLILLEETSFFSLLFKIRFYLSSLRLAAVVRLLQLFVKLSYFMGILMSITGLFSWG